MTNPIRLRLSRKRGFNLQEHSRAINGLDAVNCSRPHALGNPFVVGIDGDAETCVALFKGRLDLWMWTNHPTPHRCDLLFAAQRKAIADARGKNCACWCALDATCHADVILEVSNK